MPEDPLSLGAHGSPKMQLCQVEGAVVDNAERLMEEFGLKPNRLVRTDTPAHRQKIVNLYVTGGFPGLMRALGMLRPLRLLEKWSQLPIETRTVEAQRVQVVAVEPAGRREIQEIETSEGTYIGEGYLMHNCYGNRMADAHNAQDVYKTGPRAGQLTDRITYRHKLGRKLTANNGGGLQWGDAYRGLHRRILAEMVRVTRPGGLVVINISNHVRNHREVDVAGWWREAMTCTGGLVPEQDITVPTQRMRYGQNNGARVEHEWVFVMRRRDNISRPIIQSEDGTCRS